MVSKKLNEYVRPQATTLMERLGEPRRFMQVLAGPRQVGKTTLVVQVKERLGLPFLYASADEPGLRGPLWIAQQWEAARALAADAGKDGAVLALDEIQKIPDWAEAVKRRWDEDSAKGIPLKVIILGSAPLLVRNGLSESLAGRFEILHLRHWSYPEMKKAFGWNLDQYVYFGGYPGAAQLVADGERWRRYVLDSLVETTISRDLLLLTRVDKPALLRSLFELGSGYSGQILSYTKMLGQLADAGNTTTLAHYLQLLGDAGMLTGLQKFAGDAARQRASSPKLQVLNNALMSAQSGKSFDEAMADREYRGRLVESAVGSYLANAAASGECRLYYWREGDREVDFVLQAGRKTVAIEVKSGGTPRSLPGMEAFNTAFHPDRCLLVGGDGIPVADFISKPARNWILG